MSNYHNILAFMDNSASSQSAFTKALFLCQKTSAKLTVLWLEKPKHFYTSWLMDRHKTDANALVHQKLDPIISAYQSKGIEIQTKVINESCEYKAILQELEYQHYDLIVKSNHKHHYTLTGGIADDWHLLRESSTPILFAGESNWQADGHLLTAIETEESSEKHQHFNRHLLDESKQVAQLLASDYHVLNCYLGESCSIAVPEDNKSACTQAELHLRHLRSLLDLDGIADDHLHIEQGLADDVIPQIASKYNANMVIIGAGEHTGFMRSLQGHTSEYVIDQLKCDVLAIKPETSVIH